MREIVTAVEMKELDHNTIQKAGISSPVLMERAALKTVEEIVQRLKNKEKEKILVVCGTGNNGGDGLAIARLLQLRGVRTWYYIAGKEEKMTAETAGQLKTAEYYQVPRVHNLDPDEYTTIVDAIFGVGLSRPVEGKYAPAAAQAVTEAKQASDNKLSWQQQKEEQARQRKRENELKKVEARIEELETRDKEIDETMILPDICTNVAECAKLSKEKAAITEELEGLYEKWEELA